MRYFSELLLLATAILYALILPIIAIISCFI